MEEECSGRVDSKYKGPETGVRLGNNKEAQVAREEQASKRMTDFCLFNKI